MVREQPKAQFGLVSKFYTNCLSESAAKPKGRSLTTQYTTTHPDFVKEKVSIPRFL